MSIQKLVRKAVLRAGSHCRIISRDPPVSLAASIQPVIRDTLPEAGRLGRAPAGLYRMYAAADGEAPRPGELLEQAGISYLVEEVTTVRLGEEALYYQSLLRRVCEEGEDG